MAKLNCQMSCGSCIHYTSKKYMPAHITVAYHHHVISMSVNCHQSTREGKYRLRCFCNNKAAAFFLHAFISTAFVCRSFRENSPGSSSSSSDWSVSPLPVIDQKSKADNADRLMGAPVPRLPSILKKHGTNRYR